MHDVADIFFYDAIVNNVGHDGWQVKVCQHLKENKNDNADDMENIWLKISVNF